MTITYQTASGGNGIDQSVQCISFIPANTLSSDLRVADLIRTWVSSSAEVFSKWGGDIGQGVAITYSFYNGSVGYSQNLLQGDIPAALTLAQQNAVAAAMGAWSNVANVSFIQVIESMDLVGDIRWAGTRRALTTAPGWGSGGNGDIVIPSNSFSSPTGAWDPSSYKTYMHELGHALGLSHPHDTVTVGIEGHDQWRYSIMSYNQNGISYAPTTPMLDDILAIQYLYGANLQSHLENNTYKWDPNSVVYETIYDAGGIDTIDASNQIQSVVINLNPGTWSSIGLKVYDSVNHIDINNLLAMSYEVRDSSGNVINYIENAIGSNYDDTLIGNAANNVLDGGADNDTLSGGLGADTLIGGMGNDTLSGEDGIDTLNGGDGNDSLNGGAGDDVLDGGVGNDAMSGGVGNDTYIVDSIDDIVTENLNEGTDRVKSSITYTLNDNVEYLELTGSANINGTGNALNNILFAGVGNNVLDGKAGTDAVSYVYSGAAVTVDLSKTGAQATGGSGSDTLLSIENLYGSQFNDTLSGTAGNNYINGNTGADQMSGGLGNDTYVVDNIGDKVQESVNAGTDIVQSTISYTLGDNLENLTLIGSAAINGTGNTLNNVLVGNNANNILDGGAGDDNLNGGLGADTLLGGLGNDTLTGADGADKLDGALGDDILNGGAGADTLIGGEGADTLIGGKDNDIYVVDNVGDQVQELLNEGADLVKSSITYALGSNLENLTLTGTNAINGTGNSVNNILTGNDANNVLDSGAGDDTLNGGAGVDTMIGGIGNDTYVVDNVNDIVTENINEGNDRVNSSSTYILSSNLENLQLLGSDNINGTGNALNNIIYANSGNNVLDGKEGIDGASYYYSTASVNVDLSKTVAQNTGGSGSDTLINIENLYGSQFNDVLIGNSGNNYLNGYAGADQMSGGLGNDNYAVDNVGDVVQESTNSGTDAVVSSIASYTLTDNVENLTLSGSAALNGTGNNLNNTITGNDANNVLDGGAGNDVLNGGAGADTLIGGIGTDTLIGGVGDDTYIIDDVVDQIQEGINAGMDTVRSSISYVLGSNIENLTLVGASNINGTGNDAGNVLIGNSGANMLSGGVGNDTLDGAAGADTLAGGLGDDVYIVDNLSDRIQEVIGEGIDTVQTSVDFYGLADNVENLILAGDSIIKGYGSNGDNTLIGNAANNVLDGRAGNDILEGGPGNDSLIGGSGADTMIGGFGFDSYDVDDIGDIVIENANEGGGRVSSFIDYILGSNLQELSLQGANNINGMGNDLNNIIYASSGNNIIDGASGTDRVSYYYFSTSGVTVDLSRTDAQITGGSGTDTLLNIENLFGSKFGDKISGNSDVNYLYGDNGDDYISGSLGNDTLQGGLGMDTFVFNTSLNASTNKDMITDFNVVDDTICLAQAIFTQLVNMGVLNESNFCSNITGQANDSDDFIIYNQTSGVLSYDADANGVGASVAFAVMGVTSHPILTAADFTVV